MAAISPATQRRVSADVSIVYLYLLRATYLLIAAGMGIQIWPALLHHSNWTLMHGVADSFFGALTLLCLLGVRYPVRMLPLLFFEFCWKAIWLLAVYVPLWQAHHVDPDTADSFFAVAMGVVLVPIVLPWRYVWRTYVAQPAERWR